MAPGTRVYLEIEITVTTFHAAHANPYTAKLFLGSNPPTFCNTNCHKDALVPPTWNVKFWAHSWNLFVACRKYSARSQKTWISSVRAISEQVIRCSSPASGIRTLEKWRSTKSVVTTPSLAVRNCLYGLPNIALALDIYDTSRGW